MELPSREVIESDVRRALSEDVGPVDLTAMLIPATAEAEASVVSRDSAVVCGRAWFDAVFRLLDPRVRVDWAVADGERVDPNRTLCTLFGPARVLLTGERTALNFLQTLSGTATRARAYAEAVEGTGVKVLDTRKTVPGLRQAQKYAVRCGGCHNHRMGLYDGVLIKENHIVAAGSISAAVSQARTHARHVRIEVEVEDLHQAREALAAGADILLLDNMTSEQMTAAAELVAGRAEVEASGGITLENIGEIARTGVDSISVGGITKDVKAIDLSMRFTFAR